VYVSTVVKQRKTIGRTARTAVKLFKRKHKMKKVNWWIVGIVAIIAVLFLFGGGMMYGGWGYRGWGMMRGPGMMGWGYSPFGWFGMGLGMIFMWLIPIGLIALVVLGVASFLRNSGNPTLQSTQNPCPNCGKGVQTDWNNCPHCGTTLK
jgi:zinc-ribbon domain